MKKNNKKGFTLAELLIVVAIIAVLVAIAIPVFSSQLEKAKEATDLSNVRAAYAEAVSAYLSEGTTGSYSVTLNSNTSDVKSTGNVAGVDVAKILNTNPTVIKVSAGGSVTINDVPATTSIGTYSSGT